MSNGEPNSSLWDARDVLDTDRGLNYVKKQEEGRVSLDHSTSPPASPRRDAICTELEKFTFMENGESLLAGHKKLIVKDYLEGLHYIWSKPGAKI